jgi:hypothetical protein
MSQKIDAGFVELNKWLTQAHFLWYVYLSLHSKNEVHNICPAALHAKRNLQLPKVDLYLHLIYLVSPLAYAAMEDATNILQNLLLRHGDAGPKL